MRLRVVFLGTPKFAVPSLQALVAAGHDIPAVYTQRPRPAGRGQRDRKTAVHEAADQLGLPTRIPESLRGYSEQSAFTDLRADVGIVVAYGLMLPPDLLGVPRLGFINLHASLLPRWRGAAPIQHAILAGDEVHGFTLMQIDAGLDTGPILSRQELKFGLRPSAGELHDAIARDGAAALAGVLENLAMGRLIPQRQSREGVTVAPKFRSSDAGLDWSLGSEHLDRLVRAFSPQPGAWFNAGGVRLRALAAEPVLGVGKPGTVLTGLTIACGSGALKITQVQRPGKQPVAAEAFLRGFRMPPGTVLDGSE